MTTTQLLKRLDQILGHAAKAEPPGHLPLIEGARETVADLRRAIEGELPAETRGRKPKLPDLTPVKARRLIKAHGSARKAAAALGVSVGTVLARASLSSRQRRTA